MATLTYWVAACITDSDVYSVVAKTKKECIEKLSSPDNQHNKFEAPIKREVYYKDAFDLMDFLTGEGGGRS